MAQPLETVLIKCPICSNEVKDIPINNEEMLEMCTNTKCIYPFTNAGTMTIKRLDNSGIFQMPPVTTEQKIQENILDIQQFLDGLSCSMTQEVPPEVSDIISELMKSDPTFQEKG